MTEATFQLTDEALRVLKAYTSLSGKSVEDVTTEISDLVSSTLTKELKNKIAKELNLSEQQQPKKRVFVNQDTTGISDGLGDEDPEPEVIEGVEDPMAQIPQTGGLSERAIDDDMEIDNPQAEAKADATMAKLSPQEEQENPESVFDEIDHRIAKRKKVSKTKGKVTPLNYNEAT